MRPYASRPSRLGRRFTRSVLLLAPLVLAMGVAGIVGLARLNAQLAAIEAENLQHVVLTARLGDAMDDVAKTTLQLIPASEAREHRELDARLRTRLMPAAERLLGEMQKSVEHPSAEPVVHGIEQRWQEFLELYGTGRFDVTGTGDEVTRPNDRLARRTATVFARIRVATDRLAELEASEAADAHRRAERIFRMSVAIMLALFALTVGVGTMIVVRLTRAIVPRAVAYAAFAAAAARGEAPGRAEVAGDDELAELGDALNTLVAGRERELEYERTQSEFTDTLQLTEGESEAHDLLRRHLERSMPGSRVVVMNRNNSADRLEATTPVDDLEPVRGGLEGAKPRACLAVRFAHAHERTEAGGLVTCEVCDRASPHTMCTPLLVGGEVIGSVLVASPGPLDEPARLRIRESVGQAAPVLANLRNLAIAELRAATDVLTGLPNTRAARDTLRRMVGHALRGREQLAVLVLDLDHFKDINDTYGHGAGDDVLAAVGATLVSSLRESDFAARHGGEEFMVLLPGTGAEGAELVSEKIRAAIEKLDVATVQRAITTSVGVALVPDHGTDADTVLRSADRALYAAKAAGRNRVEVAMDPEPREAAETAAGASFGRTGPRCR